MDQLMDGSTASGRVGYTYPSPFINMYDVWRLTAVCWSHKISTEYEAEARRGELNWIE